MNSTPTYAVGDTVIVDPAVAAARPLGVVYRITQLLTVNVVVEPVGGGRPMKINPGYLQPAPATDHTTDTDTADTGTAATGTAATGTAGGTATVATVPYEAPLDQGTLVTVAGPGWRQPPGELYVVLRDNGTGRASIVKLGGAGGRYWRGVARRLLTVIDPARVRLDPEHAT
jgi:hypothetical protein